MADDGLADADCERGCRGDCPRRGLGRELCPRLPRPHRSASTARSRRSPISTASTCSRRRAALDERRAQGRPLGPLHGIPVAIKDIIDTADYPTELGSPLAAGRRPWHDATVVAKLRAAGAVIIGKTVTTEFAYFHPGPTRNPHDHDAHARRLVVGLGGGGRRPAWCRSRSARRPTGR